MFIEQKQGVSQKYNWESNVPFMVFISLIVGALSGLVNAFLLSKEVSNPRLWAGFVFGVITLVWFLVLLHNEHYNTKKLAIGLVWVASSVLSYYLALMVVIWAGSWDTISRSNGHIALAGLVGVFVVATAFHFLFRKIQPVLWVLLCLSGTLIPVLVLLAFEGIALEYLYIIWQGVITMLLGYASVRKDSKKSEQNNSPKSTMKIIIVFFGVLASFLLFLVWRMYNQKENPNSTNPVATKIIGGMEDKNKDPVSFDGCLAVGANPQIIGNLFSKDKAGVHFKENLVFGADPATFEVPGDGAFARDKDRVYYEYYPIEGADPKTFILLPYAYAKDRNHVYDFYHHVIGADPNTFEVIGFGEAKDRHHTYYQHQMLGGNGGDSATLEKITYANDNSYARDSKNVYFVGNLIPNADPNTFEVLSLSNYGKDANHVFYLTETLLGATPSTFEAIEFSSYAKDKRHVYYETNPLKDADPSTFHILPSYNSEIAKDKSHVYYIGHLVPADAASFEVIDGHYSKDRNSVYYEGHVVCGADLETFETVSGDTMSDLKDAKDKRYKYYQGHVLPANYLELNHK